MSSVAQQELLEKARKQASSELSVLLIEEGVSFELQQLASEVLQEEKAKRDAALGQIAEEVVKRRMVRYYDRYGNLHLHHSSPPPSFTRSPLPFPFPFPFIHTYTPPPSPFPFIHTYTPPPLPSFTRTPTSSYVS